MNRLPDILKEVAQLQRQKANLDASNRAITDKIAELTNEWQALCGHPEEYIQVFVQDNIIYTKCCACNRMLNEETLEERE